MKCLTYKFGGNRASTKILATLFLSSFQQLPMKLSYFKFFEWKKKKREKKFESLFYISSYINHTIFIYFLFSTKKKKKRKKQFLSSSDLPSYLLSFTKKLYIESSNKLLKNNFPRKRKPKIQNSQGSNITATFINRISIPLRLEHVATSTTIS